MSLRERIEALAAENRKGFTESERQTFIELRELLTRGEVRAAERSPAGQWTVNSWVKQGILLGFRMGEIADLSPADHTLVFLDKDTYPVQEFQTTDRVRIVPGGSSVRSGAHLAAGVVCMPPMYVNVGAY